MKGPLGGGVLAGTETRNPRWTPLMQELGFVGLHLRVVPLFNILSPTSACLSPSPEPKLPEPINYQPSPPKACSPQTQNPKPYNPKTL